MTERERKKENSLKEVRFLFVFNFEVERGGDNINLSFT